MATRFLFILTFASTLFQLYKSVYITRFLCGLLLIVFALSITPKKYLHNAFATHVDNGPTESSSSPYQLDTPEYNCDIDNVVAESSFVNEQRSDILPLLSSFPSYLFKNISPLSTTVIYSLLRGPPVKI